MAVTLRDAGASQVEAPNLDYDQIPLADIDPADIVRIFITHRGAVSIKTAPESIEEFWLSHPSLALEYRAEWHGYTTRKTGRYQSVCVEVQA